MMTKVAAYSSVNRKVDWCNRFDTAPDRLNSKKLCDLSSLLQVQIPCVKAINLMKPRNQPKVTRPFFPRERAGSGHETIPE